MSIIKKITHHPFIIKLTHWEYWSFNAVYGPIYLYWVWLGIKSRSFFFVNAANPTITNGGFLMESKNEIYNLIPKKYYPVTVFLLKGTSTEEALIQMKNADIQFPFIAKPDIGGRGRMVCKINNEAELGAYINTVKENFLLQQMVQWQQEAGIFYYRFPNEENGHISGIVAKEFLTVTGDGKHTILELLQQEKRFILQIPELQKVYGTRLQQVLQPTQQQVLVPYGNHARGSKFLDAGNKIDAALTETIDAVCKQIPGFYFGRMDIKFNTWEELKQGKNFSIIELNGSGSEPTHIYDPKHSIFFAWKEIIRHWRLLQRICAIN
ncbi:MAG TPA: hypothetical protein PLA68_04930, partial [Panacibacter sp.]|nr:hypothetical protein [Panacibacter sp.]